MLLRKINAGLSLLTTVLFVNHAALLSVWMLSRCSIARPAKAMSFVLVALTSIHAVLSIVAGILGHKNAEKRECKEYPEMNVATNVQRISGILMIVLMGLHIAGAANHFQPKMLHAVLHPLFFAVSIAHVAVSISKALITLGIGNAKAIKVIDIIAKIICVATLIASIVGFYLCLFAGVA